jgi:CheY-like chemotaxis protein
MSRILVVDDHPISREPLARLLRHEGYDTACAANGLEAVEEVRRRRPDLILLDLMMPKMSGLAFLEVLRAELSVAASHAGRAGSDDAGEVRVIVLTAVANLSEVARVRELGVKDIILKSKFDVDDLLGRVKTLLPLAHRSSAQPAV